jgi:hypothetical protein
LVCSGFLINWFDFLANWFAVVYVSQIDLSVGSFGVEVGVSLIDLSVGSFGVEVGVRLIDLSVGSFGVEVGVSLIDLSVGWFAVIASVWGALIVGICDVMGRNTPKIISINSTKLTKLPFSIISIFINLLIFSIKAGLGILLTNGNSLIVLINLSLNSVCNDDIFVVKVAYFAVSLISAKSFDVIFRSFNVFLSLQDFL